MESAFMDLISVLGVLAGSSLFGVVKKQTMALDGKIGKAVKPMQPALVMAAGVGLPYLTDALGIAAVDPSVFITAPTATIAVVTVRETAARIRGKK